MQYYSNRLSYTVSVMGSQNVYTLDFLAIIFVLIKIQLRDSNMFTKKKKTQMFNVWHTHFFP